MTERATGELSHSRKRPAPALDVKLPEARAEGTMSFGIYMIGFIVLIIGLSLGAYLMHMPPQWIGVGVIVLIGLGILLGVTSTKQRDSN